VKGAARRILKWGPLAIVIAWLAREASHIAYHIAAPQTLAIRQRETEATAN